MAASNSTTSNDKGADALLEEAFLSATGAGGMAPLSAVRVLLGPDNASGPMNWKAFEPAAVANGVTGEAALQHLLEPLGGWSRDDLAAALGDLLDPALQLQLQRLRSDGQLAPAEVGEWLLAVRQRHGNAKPTLMRDALQRLRRARTGPPPRATAAGGGGAAAFRNAADQLRRVSTAANAFKDAAGVGGGGGAERRTFAKPPPPPSHPGDADDATPSAAAQGPAALRRAVSRLSGGAAADGQQGASLRKSPVSAPPPPAVELATIETQTDPPPAPPATTSTEAQAEIPAAPVPSRDVGLQVDPPAEEDERAEAFELANRVEAQALGRLRDRHERAAATVAYLGQLVAKHSHLSADLDHRAAAVDEASHVARKEAALIRLAELDDEEQQLSRLIEERERASAARLAQSATSSPSPSWVVSAKVRPTAAASPPHQGMNGSYHTAYLHHADTMSAAASNPGASRVSVGSVASSSNASSRRRTWQRPPS